MAGTLFLVSTPIGNLEDISFRAVRLLKEVDLIAAEDTRRTSILLRHYGIETTLDSYHEHNKEKKARFLTKKLVQGQNIALVSDAGTPGISDPGYRLIQEVLNADVDIVPIPGATAAITALSVSGLPTDRFVFEGFLPVKKGRKTRLELLSTETRTVILYESPHRLIRTLNDILTFWGNRQMTVCRELTKTFEEKSRGSVEEIIGLYSSRAIKGEFVLIIHGSEKRQHAKPIY